MNMSAPGAVNTLYIGGGTPSVLPLDVLSRIVGAVSQTERLSLVTEPVEVTTPTELFDEFTVEVNPEDIVEKGREYVRGLLALGVNRVSMGIQSFNDDILRWMNRRHDAGNAVKAFHILRESGVRNISIDLIFGISQLTDETWKDTIEKALELSPEHISAYQLSIEEGSALAKMVADGRYVEASEEQCRRQYDILQQSGVFGAQPGNLPFLFFAFGFCLCFFFGSMGDQFRRWELLGGLFPDSLEKQVHRFRPLVVSFHDLCGLFQPPGNLF